MSRQKTLDEALDEDTNPPADPGQTDPLPAPLFRPECWPSIAHLPAFLIMLTKEAIRFYYNYVIKAKLSTFKANAIANPKTSLSKCFEKLAKELKGIQGSLRSSLKDDKSLADKLYSACKNVPKTTIARINPASTFTAAIADIRRAIAFATESLRPPAKASRAYASSSEPFAQHPSQHSSQHSS
ncbi:hypothetical protein MBM_09712 [Drepanopeziza brunnea f. sp. 'multigermtubi' MB_m1]|uniref:Uncharacterized protein n=1 Tax=Marssonina brunnea f. sp. multigermtubi (strain MB_m1) TaxID=1072389 RepID=K1WJ04_MARBU|nr:uncharacterized protein MBM_09712 [Drepanopeziza brunnea f. sp. 'multigermtubi' MB_m1]EKD12132.1 hypothetical protein MBM_09712 [Drepanopeziza brunnea f. sp. 'multigermtubi' MB_m1]